MTPEEEKENQILINIESTSNQEEDLEELERVTHSLRDDLTEVDAIEKVELVAKKGVEKAPKGSKAGGEVATLGSLLITLGASALSNTIPNLSNTLQSWLTRHERRKISLEIGGDKLEITGASDEQQKQLIESWISRQSKVKGAQ